MIFEAWKKFDELSLTIKSLWGVVFLLILLNLFISIRLASLPNRIRIFVPPDLSHGTTTRVGEVPKATIYAFAFEMFSSVNTWSESGEKNYEKNIHNYRNYLTPEFYQQLKEDCLHRKNMGALSRRRIVSGVSSMGYKPTDVEKQGNGSWIVRLHLEIVETLDGNVIKNVAMTYPLIVNQVNTPIEVNRWGLQIAGFNSPPFRIKTTI